MSIYLPSISFSVSFSLITFFKGIFLFWDDSCFFASSWECCLLRNIVSVVLRGQRPLPYFRKRTDGGEEEGRASTPWMNEETGAQRAHALLKTPAARTVLLAAGALSSLLYLGPLRVGCGQGRDAWDAQHLYRMTIVSLHRQGYIVTGRGKGSLSLQDMLASAFSVAFVPHQEH